MGYNNVKSYHRILQYKKPWDITIQTTPWNITIPRIPWHIRISKSHHRILQYQKPTMGCYDARITSWNIKVHQSRYRPEVSRGFQEVKVPRLYYKGPGLWVGCQPYAPDAFYPQELHLVLIYIRGWVDPRAIVQSEGNSNYTIWNRTSDLPICSTAP